MPEEASVDTPAVIIAVDALGGDHAPEVVLAGVTAALEADSRLYVALVGPADLVEPFAAAHDRVKPVIANDVIGMDEHPAAAVRSKKGSTIVVGCRLVKDGAAAGFFSAGNTGACMAAATLIMGRLPGVLRPAIATVVPASAKPSVLLDIGANADCKPENLVQFAHMGRAYAQAVLDVAQPSVGLLNIGEEPTKGSQLALGAHALMRDAIPGFVGNVEGRDIPTGLVDVIVTDGFTGNVALKLLEGLARTLLSQVKDAMTSTAVRTAAAAVLRRPLVELKNRIDPETYGGAPLLGVAGVCSIGHGSSGVTGITNGIAISARAVRGGLTERIAAAVRSEAGQ
jgi:glycerol-3-phosphate acyltransferase PlsX